MIVPLATWRQALKATEILNQMLQQADWVLKVSVSLLESGEPAISVRVNNLRTAVRCMPVRINGIEIRLER
jgi:hypothetical protein